MQRKHRKNTCDPIDTDRIKIDLQSPDAAVRARAVRALCPCHSGWQSFEQNLKIVAALQKDESPLVRAAALHVFEDAAEIQSSGYPTNPREVSNEMLRKKRASRFPAEPDDVAEKVKAKRRG